AGGDARGRPRAARRRRLGARQRARRDAGRGRLGAGGDRRRRAAGRARSEQGRRARPAGPTAFVEPLPRLAAGLGAYSGGPRRAAGAGGRAVRRALRRSAPADSLRRGSASGGAVRARHARRRAGRPARGRLRARAPAAARGAPVRAVPDRRSRGTVERVIELPIRRLHENAVMPERAYAGDAGLDLAACERHELGPGERALVGTGLAVAIPEGHAGFVQPRSGLAARHGLTVVNSPGLIDEGYRGEIRIVLLHTEERHPVW